MTSRPHSRAATGRRRAIAAALLALFAALAAAAGAASPRLPLPAVNRSALAGHGDLAFVSRGRLWLLDGARGTLRAMTAPGTVVVSQPRFAPDGRWLSYLAGGRVWLAGIDAGTSGAARAVATAAGALAGRWLPDGRLLAGGAVWAIAAGGAPQRDGAVPRGLAAWSADGRSYVFFESTLAIAQGHASAGVQRLELAATLHGPRTTWLRRRVSFSPRSGLHGAFLHDAVALAGGAGVLFRLDPGDSSSIEADGLGLYELSRRGAAPVRLGTLVGLPVALGPSGRFAITDGPDRYAWLTKTVKRCAIAAATCAPVTSRPGAVSLDPAWSPTGALAFVTAPSSTSGSFGQGAVRRWYAEHELWTLGPGAPRAAPVAAATGAAAPLWSADGRSLLYVADDALWLLPALSAAPVRIAGPLFAPDHWPSYYGQVDWTSRFAWLSVRSPAGA